MYLNLNTYADVYVYVHICTYTYPYVYKSIHIHIHMCIYRYIITCQHVAASPRRYHDRRSRRRHGVHSKVKLAPANSDEFGISSRRARQTRDETSRRAGCWQQVKRTIDGQPHRPALPQRARTSGVGVAGWQLVREAPALGERTVKCPKAASSALGRTGARQAAIPVLT